jgi:hypothetical protein
MKSCEGGVLKKLRDLLTKRIEHSSRKHDGEEFHSSEQNAWLVRDAQECYREMYYSSDARGLCAMHICSKSWIACCI